MYQFGPYGPNHATAATFAFKRDLLKQTRFNETSCVAEEKKFLNDYTIPFVQLDADKSILVFSHNHNSFDKKELLKQMPNPHIHDTNVEPRDLVKEPDILKFFMEDIDDALNNYEQGKLDYKPDVKKQIEELKLERETKVREMLKQQEEMNKINIINEQATQIQQLTQENTRLREQLDHVNTRIKQLIVAQIEQRQQDKSNNDKQLKDNV